MDPLCSSTRDWLASEAAMFDAPEGSILEHLQACADCRAFQDELEAGLPAQPTPAQAGALQGLERRSAPDELDALVAKALRSEAGDLQRERRAVEALSRLRPLSAPGSLDGSVVAALHAGSREERSLRHLRALDRLDTPAALDQRAAEECLEPEGGDATRVLAAPASPAVLERLVREDLADLPRALVRRFTSKLPRLTAPAELEARVRAELGGTGSDRDDTIQPWAGRRLSFPTLLTAAAASLLLGVFGWTQLADLYFGSSDAVDEPELAALPIELRRLSAQDAFSSPDVDPLTRRIADEISGSRLSLLDGPSSGGDLFASEGSADDDPQGDSPSDEDAPDDGTGDGADGSQSGNAQPGNSAQPLVQIQRVAPVSRRILSRMEAAHLAAVRLVRQVELHDPANPSLDTSYEETLLRDGAGGFAVQPGTVFHPALTPDEEVTFDLLQGARQGFIERHRDFRIRDGQLFLENYLLHDLGQSVSVAGVPCQMLEVRSRYHTNIWWRLAVDPVSGLVLLEERRDQHGALLARIEVLAVDVLPDLSGDVIDGGPSAWTPLSAVEQLGLQIHVPTVLPLGYELVETAALSDGFGRQWVRQLFTDGVSELFFLHDLGQPRKPVNGVPTQSDVLNAFSIGGLRVLDGELRGVRLIAVGSMRELDLLSAINSALP